MEVAETIGAVILETQLLHDIDTRLTRIQEILSNFQLRLLGADMNGGELAKIHARLDALEAFKWKAVGVMGTALFLFEALKTIKH